MEVWGFGVDRWFGVWGFGVGGLGFRSHVIFFKVSQTSTPGGFGV